MEAHRGPRGVVDPMSGVYQIKDARGRVHRVAGADPLTAMRRVADLYQVAVVGWRESRNARDAARPGPPGHDPTAGEVARGRTTLTGSAARDGTAPDYLPRRPAAPAARPAEGDLSQGTTPLNATDPTTTTTGAGPTSTGPTDASVEDTGADQQVAASEQALRNFIALAPYARSGDPGSRWAAGRGVDAALVRAVQVGAITAGQAQRELSARWAARPDPSSTAVSTADTAGQVPDRFPIARDLAVWIAEDAIGLFLDNRDQHGLDETQARAASILQIAEGVLTPDDPVAAPPAVTAPADTAREPPDDGPACGRLPDAVAGNGPTTRASSALEPVTTRAHDAVVESGEAPPTQAVSTGPSTEPTTHHACGREPTAVLVDRARAAVAALPEPGAGAGGPRGDEQARREQLTVWHTDDHAATTAESGTGRFDADDPAAGRQW